MFGQAIDRGRSGVHIGPQGNSFLEDLWKPVKRQRPQTLQSKLLADLRKWGSLHEKNSLLLHTLSRVFLEFSVGLILQKSNSLSITVGGTEYSSCTAGKTVSSSLAFRGRRDLFPHQSGCPWAYRILTVSCWTLAVSSGKAPIAFSTPYRMSSTGTTGGVTA